MSGEVEVRYYLEQSALPHAFYDNGIQLMYTLLMSKGGAAVRGFYAKAEKANPEYVCPYSSSDFDISVEELSGQRDSVLIISISMPVPEESPLCRAIYLCYGRENRINAFFTSELTAKGDFTLCRWTEDGMHINMGCDSGVERNRVEKEYWRLVNYGRPQKLKVPIKIDAAFLKRRQSLLKAETTI